MPINKNVKSVWADDIKADYDRTVADAQAKLGETVTMKSSGPQAAGGTVRVAPYETSVINPDSTRGSE